MSEDQSGVEVAEQTREDNINAEKALVPVAESAALSIYGDAEDAYILASRMMQFHPAAREVGKAVILAAAQVAIALGANPLPGAGELDIWQDKKNQNHIRLGVQFHRRKAREGGGISWRIRPRLMTKPECELYGIGDHEIGAIGDGARLSDMLAMRAQGLTPDEVWDSLGAVGIGLVNKNDRAKAGRPVSWTAIKRAEQDCIRQLFPNCEGLMGSGPAAGLPEAAGIIDMVPAAVTMESNGVLESEPDEPEPADYEILEPEPEPESSEPPPGNGRDIEVDLSAEQIRGQIRKAAGWFPTGDRPEPGEQADKITREQVGLVASVMGKALADIPSKGDLRNKARRSVLVYLFGVDSTNDLSKAEASAVLDRWLIHGLYDLEEWAIPEAARLVKAMLLESGQTKMDLD